VITMCANDEADALLEAAGNEGVAIEAFDGAVNMLNELASGRDALDSLTARKPYAHSESLGGGTG